MVTWKGEGGCINSTKVGTRFSFSSWEGREWVIGRRAGWEWGGIHWSGLDWDGHGLVICFGGLTGWPEIRSYGGLYQCYFLLLFLHLLQARFALLPHIIILKSERRSEGRRTNRDGSDSFINFTLIAYVVEP